MLTILAVALLAALPALAGAQAPPALPAIPQQTGGFATPGGIVSDGAFVVWSELIQPSRFSRHANLYAAELGSGRSFPLGERLDQAHYWTFLGPGFALDAGVAVWIDDPAYEGVGRGLVATDLRSGAVTPLSAASAAYPAISGSLVSWWELYPPTAPAVTTHARLMLANLASDDSPRILAELELPSALELRGGPLNERWAVFLRGTYDQGPERPQCWTVWAATARGGDERPVAELGCPADNQEPRLALRGDRVAVTDGAGLLRVIDLASGAVRVSGPHGNVGQAWGGDLLFWATQGREVWGYDPGSDSAFLVARDVRSYAVATGGGALSYFAGREPDPLSVVSRPIVALLPTARRAAGDPTVQGRRLFAETGHSLGGEFEAYWRRNGGLAVFGYPLSEEFVQRAPGEQAGYSVQYLERQRFEFHPENQAPYQVLLGRLGAEALAAQGRDWQSFPQADPAAPGYFPQTGQAIAPEFLAYWRANGLELGDAGVSEREALALWGYPLSPPQLEAVEGRQVLVQWFERARFEHHPQNPEPFRVLLGRLAADRVDAFGWP